MRTGENMSDYILRYRTSDDSLSHDGQKGQKWGVVRKHVGKYYIPKGRNGINRAIERLGDDVRDRKDRFTKKMDKLNADHDSGKISDEKYVKLGKKEAQRYKKDQEAFNDRAEKLRAASSKLTRKKDLSKLSDEELESLMKRTNQEKVTYNNLKQIREHEDGSSKSNKKAYDDLVKSAKDIKSTLDEPKKEYKKNPPLKEQKKKDLSYLSDDEIRRAIDRAKLEYQYNDIVNTPQVDRGKMRAAAALSTIGGLVVLGTQVAGLVGTIKEVKNI